MSFIDGLLPASWRGIPFDVKEIATRVGRRVAVHEYPFRDVIWVEDLGRGVRAFGFRGYIAGDLAAIQRAAMLRAVEQKGPGTLTHPTLGIFTCSIVSFSSVESDEALGVFELQFEFLETGVPAYPTSATDTLAAVSLGSLNLLSAGGSDFAGSVINAIGLGAAVLDKAQEVLTDWVSLPLALASDASAIIGTVTGLGSIFGRYEGGSGTPTAPQGSTPTTLLAANVVAQQAVAVTAAALQAAAETGDPAAIATTAQAVAAASLAAATSPADQVRILVRMASFSPSASTDISAIGQAQATAQTATGALCRRVALATYAQATSAYQPASYDEALALRTTADALFDAEIVIAGDLIDDASGTALRQLRTAVFDNLTARGADLAPLKTVTFGETLPAFVVAQRLYQDATRAPELIGRTGVIHPAFMPLGMQVLAY